MNIVESLTFDDVMLVPKYSEISSRENVDIRVKVCKDFIFSLPFVPSNMQTVTGIKMARLMYDHKSLAVLHRFTDNFEEQLSWLEEVKSWADGVRFVGFSVGIRQEEYKKVDHLVKSGAQIICVDVAHGYSADSRAMISYIATTYPHVLLIAGNSAEGEGARFIWKSGADICKNGVGQGSICTTRIHTGNGFGSLTALESCHTIRKGLERELGRRLFLMQDGGCSQPGHFAKALCFTDIVMTGNMFAATDETPGELVTVDQTQYKRYVGSSTHKKDYREGVESLKAYKGSASLVIKAISEGVKSCCSYQGTITVDGLKRDPRFCRLTNAGIQESGAHDLDIILR